MEVFYCDTKLKKGIDYEEIQIDNNEISDAIQFLNTIGDLDMSNVEEFENFEETLEFVVQGDYSES